MKRSWRLRLRVPLGDVARRAAGEAFADGHYEIRTARTFSGRLAGLAGTVAALIRVSLNIFDVFDHGHPMGNLTQDLRLSVRRLLATPVFTVFSVLTLAVGIGATTAIYSVVRAFTGPPAGVADVDRLVNITHMDGGASIPQIALSYGDFLDLKSRQTAFQGVAGWSFFRQSFTANGESGTAFAEAVSGDYFSVLGVAAQKGRTIQTADDVAGAPLVTVISHGIWQRLFGGAPDVIGRTIKVNGESLEIVGVAPASFAGLFNSGLVPSAMWVSLNSLSRIAGPGSAASLDLDERDRRWVQVRARLKPDTSLEQARADVFGIASALDQAAPIGRDLDARFRYPGNISRPWTVRPTRDVPVNEGAARLVGPIATTFLVAVGLVLLVACTNLSNMMLARGSERRSELAVRLSLGASRWQLIWVAFVECLLLAMAGGVLGVGLARWLFVTFTDDFSVGNGAALHLSPNLDFAVLVSSALATGIVLLVAGLIPAWQSTRGDLRSSLASGTQASLPRWRGRRSLIAMQVMVSVLLVSAAALCLTTLSRQSHPDTGMDLEHIAVAQIDFASQKYGPQRTRDILDAVLRPMSGRPGVTAVSASSGLPIGLTNPGAQIGVAGKVMQFAQLLASTPGVFRTLGVKVIRGRAFEDGDIAGARPVVVVSERTAKMLFNRTDVIGEVITLQRRRWAGEQEHPMLSLAIVGVASDTDAGSAGRRDSNVVYVPLAQQYEGNLVLAARVDGDPAPVVKALKQAIVAADTDVAVVQAGTGLEVAAPSNLGLQIFGAVSGVLGLFALVLALAGLYGVLSHVVARRTREMGLRLALGAHRADIVRLVVRDGMRPVLSGLAAGLLIALIFRLMAQPLFVSLLPSFDPVVVTMVPALMVVAAFVACYLPARRAAQVEPNVALRDV